MRSMLIEGDLIRMVCPRCGKTVRAFEARDLGMLITEAINHQADCDG